MRESLWAGLWSEARSEQGDYTNTTLFYRRQLHPAANDLHHLCLARAFLSLWQQHTPSNASLAGAGTLAALMSPAHPGRALIAAHAPTPQGLQTAKREELERDSAWFMFSPRTYQREERSHMQENGADHQSELYTHCQR